MISRRCPGTSERREQRKMNQALKEKLSAILGMNLKKDYTSVSYAIMRHGEILAADSLGTQGGEEKKPADTNCTYNVASVSKIYCTVAVMQLVEQGKPLPFPIEGAVIYYVGPSPARPGQAIGSAGPTTS